VRIYQDRSNMRAMRCAGYQFAPFSGAMFILVTVLRRNVAAAS